MTLANWCICPVSGMPALLPEYKKILTEDDMSCPVGEGRVDPAKLRLAEDPAAELKALTASPKEEAEEEEEEEEDEEEKDDKDMEYA
mmetsp:Transcript_32679/g.37307  ORF Transcript_32679/g.37307 Transcript_32679/m.37307 type:complete len:87 (-) Transcript_32679:8-268(-)